MENKAVKNSSKISRAFRRYLKLISVVVILMAILFAGCILILDSAGKGGSGRPYRVEAERIATRIERGESYDLSSYKYITDVRSLDEGYQGGSSDHLVMEINGKLYRFEYSYLQNDDTSRTLFMISFVLMAVFVLVLLTALYFMLIRPFERISGYPEELAKGNLTIPLKESKNEYFGRFLWGLDMLREKLEKQRSAQLALQKQNKTMILSLSHDIKTPLGVIKLYAKALEKGLYKDEKKKLEIAESINDKCGEIGEYVDAIVRSSSEDFLDLEVHNGDFYLSELMTDVREFYSDKLELLKIPFYTGSFSDCILYGDPERAAEVMQNIIENAIKYGDGKEISISYSREEDCQLIHIFSSGSALGENEISHIFDSFWRGSNTGSQSGSGLGLYICRSLMYKMNGDIYARMENNGLTVTVIFVIS